MNKEKAQAWVDGITKLLVGRELVTVAVTPVSGVEVRLRQQFNKAYFVEHTGGSCSIAICDTYGVMSGAEDWKIDPNKRSLHAKTTNAYGETCQFAWTISKPDDEGLIWQEMHDIRNTLQRIT